MAATEWKLPTHQVPTVLRSLLRVGVISMRSLWDDERGARDQQQAIRSSADASRHSSTVLSHQQDDSNVQAPEYADHHARTRSSTKRQSHQRSSDIPYVDQRKVQILQLEEQHNNVLQLFDGLCLENKVLHQRDEVLTALLQCMDELGESYLTSTGTPVRSNMALNEEQASKCAGALKDWNTSVDRLSKALLYAELDSVPETLTTLEKALTEHHELTATIGRDIGQYPTVLAMNLSQSLAHLKVPEEQHWLAVAASLQLSEEQILKMVLAKEILFRKFINTGSLLNSQAPPAFPSAPLGMRGALGNFSQPMSHSHSWPPVSFHPLHSWPHASGSAPPAPWLSQHAPQSSSSSHTTSASPLPSPPHPSTFPTSLFHGSPDIIPSSAPFPSSLTSRTPTTPAPPRPSQMAMTSDSATLSLATPLQRSTSAPDPLCLSVHSSIPLSIPASFPISTDPSVLLSLPSLELPSQANLPFPIHPPLLASSPTLPLNPSTPTPQFPLASPLLPPLLTPLLLPTPSLPSSPHTSSLASPAPPLPLPDPPPNSPSHAPNPTTSPLLPSIPPLSSLSHSPYSDPTAPPSMPPCCAAPPSCGSDIVALTEAFQCLDTRCTFAHPPPAPPSPPSPAMLWQQLLKGYELSTTFLDPQPADPTLALEDPAGPSLPLHNPSLALFGPQTLLDPPSNPDGSSPALPGSPAASPGRSPEAPDWFAAMRNLELFHPPAAALGDMVPGSSPGLQAAPPIVNLEEYSGGGHDGQEVEVYNSGISHLVEDGLEGYTGGDGLQWAYEHLPPIPAPPQLTQSLHHTSQTQSPPPPHHSPMSSQPPPSPLPPTPNFPPPAPMLLPLGPMGPRPAPMLPGHPHLVVALPAPPPPPLDTSTVEKVIEQGSKRLVRLHHYTQVLSHFLHTKLLTPVQAAKAHVHAHPMFADPLALITAAEMHSVLASGR